MEIINKHIEIVRSTRGGLSSLGEPSCDAIYKILAAHYMRVGITIVNSQDDLIQLVESKPDLVFLGMKFVPSDDVIGEKIWLAEYLQANGIKTTGSSSDAHRLELNKSLAKQRAIDAGIKTSPFYVSKQHTTGNDGHLTLDYPMFVKPTSSGGGLGVDHYSVVHNITQLDTKIASISFNHNSDSIIEQYLPGREFSVALLLDLETGVKYTMPLELVAPLNKEGDRFLSNEIKQADTESAIEITDKALSKSLNALALDVFRALGAKDYGRIDIRLDANGVPNFLEANLIPSLLDKYGNFPKACLMHLGMQHEEIILRITDLALNRKPQLIIDRVKV